MRFGLTILPEHHWSDAAPRWRAAEQWGFDHAWTYDHLVWAGLPESKWFGTTPTLTAAALATTTIRLGTFVASPNFRHPVALHRDVQALDDISGGRFLLGIGTGGDLDSTILGGEPLTVRQRVDRFAEFTRLLIRLRTEDHVTSTGLWFSSVDARTQPPLVGVPLLIAANGPRSVRFAAAHGDGWITTGARADTVDAWFDGLAVSRDLLDEELVAAGRDPARFDRYLHLDSSPQFSLASAAVFTEMVGRAAELGFTDVITHWPRPDGPYAGDVSVLEAVVADVLPRYRTP